MLQISQFQTSDSSNFTKRKIWNPYVLRDMSFFFIIYMIFFLCSGHIIVVQKKISNKKPLTKWQKKTKDPKIVMEARRSCFHDYMKLSKRITRISRKKKFRHFDDEHSNVSVLRISAPSDRFQFFCGSFFGYFNGFNGKIAHF
jgi:hypothetical protein